MSYELQIPTSLVKEIQSWFGDIWAADLLDKVSSIFSLDQHENFGKQIKAPVSYFAMFLREASSKGTVRVNLHIDLNPSTGQALLINALHYVGEPKALEFKETELD